MKNPRSHADIKLMLLIITEFMIQQNWYRENVIRFITSK